MKIKHYPIRTEESATQPMTLFCPCGYSSTNTKEFVPISIPSFQGVTCEGALKYFGKSVVIVEGGKNEG